MSVKFPPSLEAEEIEKLEIKTRRIFFSFPKKTAVRERAGKIHQETLSKCSSQNKIFFQFV
jgi:hypothetical protein